MNSSLFLKDYDSVQKSSITDLQNVNNPPGAEAG